MIVNAWMMILMQMITQRFAVLTQKNLHPASLKMDVFGDPLISMNAMSKVKKSMIIQNTQDVAVRLLMMQMKLNVPL